MPTATKIVCFSWIEESTWHKNIFRTSTLEKIYQSFYITASAVAAATHTFCFITIWPRSPVRIMTQVQWFMYQNQLELSGGIKHLYYRCNRLLWLRVNCKTVLKIITPWAMCFGIFLSILNNHYSSHTQSSNPSNSNSNNLFSKCKPANVCW